MSSTVSSVPCCVEPPAPKVTEKKRGLSFASSCHVARSFALPSSVFGGNNSKLNVRDADNSIVMSWTQAIQTVVLSAVPSPVNIGNGPPCKGLPYRHRYRLPAYP